jgi:Universal stress protein family
LIFGQRLSDRADISPKSAKFHRFRHVCLSRATSLWRYARAIELANRLIVTVNERDMNMTYHTILVHLTDENRAPHVLESAIALAKKNGAHLIGLHIVPIYPAYTTIGMELTTEIQEAQKTMAATDQKVMTEIFEKATSNEELTAEWRCIVAPSSQLANIVVEHCRCVDLAICGQSDPMNSLESELAVSEKILLETGRPVLIIPYAGQHRNVGEHITVAWNATRESTRAVFDAMPFLQEATDVKLLWVNPKPVNGGNTDTPGTG